MRLALDSPTTSAMGMDGVLDDARVTTVLALLRLHPDIRAAVVGLPPGTPERLITERKLRALTSVPSKAQLQALAWFLRRKAMG
jgi:hypothetical protein